MIVVYTAIFDQSDSLKQAPPADRCVCYTNDDLPTNKGWEIFQHPIMGQARKTARVLKVTPEKLFPEATASVWVDGSIQINDWSLLLTDVREAQIASFAHPDRSTCYDEGTTVIRLKLAHPSKVLSALDAYRRDGFAHTELSTTGLFYRRHTDEVARFNRLWRKHLNSYGTNDQVHVDYCAWKTGIQIHHLRGHYRDNPYAKYDQLDHHRRRKPQFLLEAECEDYMAG